MKKNFIDYYAVIMLIIFIFYNIILESLKIGGLLYQMFMILLIILNIIILIKFRKKIKYKSIIIVLYLLIWIFSKNTLQCFFAFSNIIFLCITGFKESHFIKIMSFVLPLLLFIFLPPLIFGYIATFGFGLNEEKNRNDIYSDMHYYCNNNYEVYAYSSGGFDKFHYSIGKHYEFLNIGDIIYISYNERNEKTKEEYENYLNNNNCILVGEKNGSK